MFMPILLLISSIIQLSGRVALSMLRHLKLTPSPYRQRIAQLHASTSRDHRV